MDKKKYELKVSFKISTKTCFINSIISSFTGPSEQGEFVANSHLSKIIVNNGKKGWL